MKHFTVPGTVAVAAAAVSLISWGGGGLAQAQEAPIAQAPLVVPVVEIVDSLGSFPTEDAPIVPTQDILDFLSDSINLAGRDVLQPSKDDAQSVVNKVTELVDQYKPAEVRDSVTADGGLVGFLTAAAVVAVPLAIAGALGGALGGAAIAAVLGTSVAAALLAPAIIAGLGIGVLPAALLGLAGLVVASVGGLITGLLLVTFPLWFWAGLVMVLIGAGVITFSAPLTPAVLTALLVVGGLLMVFTLLPLVPFMIPSLLFGVAAILFVLAVAVFLIPVLLLGAVMVIPALIAFAVVGGVAALTAVPSGAIGGFWVGLGVGLLAVYLWTTFGPGSRDPKEKGKKSNKKATQADFALAA